MAEEEVTKGSTGEPGGSLLRDLAHELRDALSPIASSLDLLRLQDFSPAASRLSTERIERGLRRALATLELFVAAEQCERGSLRLTLEPCDLRHIVEEAGGALEAQLAQRIVFHPSATPFEVCADRARSVQALTAVLRHAGSVALPDSAVQVRAETLDSTPVVRVDCSVDPDASGGEHWFASYRGAGGGMALRTARQIMTLQHGGLSVAMEGPAASVLLMRFAPAGARAVTDRRKAPGDAERKAGASGGSSTRVGPAGQPPRRILIVEDSADVRGAYRESLLSLGYTVFEARNAEEAVRLIADSAPQVALIDINLPGMNGYRLAQAVKAQAGPAIRLVMLSGMTLDATVRRLSLESGFDDCLDKMAGPLAVHRLLQGDLDPLA